MSALPEGWTALRVRDERTNSHHYVVTMPDGFTTNAYSRANGNTQSWVLYKLIAAMRVAESETRK